MFSGIINPNDDNSLSRWERVGVRGIPQKNPPNFLQLKRVFDVSGSKLALAVIYIALAI
jgi:hypothetical protein